MVGDWYGLTPFGPRCWGGPWRWPGMRAEKFCRGGFAPGGAEPVGMPFG
jgi:hypothetical protein